MASGFHAVYNTQFSFKNKVDDFYVQFMQKNMIRVDIYISKNNAAIHLGRAEVLLREIVERETVMQELSIKPPLIQKTVRIFGARGNSDEPIGSLRFKMRMRKPISEAIRFYRERNEINNMQLTGQEGFLENTFNARNRKKLITVQIVRCRDIKVKYAAVNQTIAPFFYYQFYTFDEHYSITGAGPNPTFEDTKSYEVELDAKLLTYLQREPLEIILFDDNAPVTGVERGGRADRESEQIDDMIGSVKITLDPLLKGSGIVDMFVIRNTKGETVGNLEAKISIIDLEGGLSSFTNRDQNQALSLHYNKQWELEFVARIARKLARFPGDVELLFGIFAKGQKTVTKEDFKYTVLKRLQLKNEISEREVDMFLRSCQVLLDKTYIDLEDFIQIFAQAITQARQDYQNEEAMQYTTIRKYESLANQSFKGGLPSQRSILLNDDALSHSTSNNNLRGTHSDSRTVLGYQEQEILDLLARTRFGNFTQMKERIRSHTSNGFILSSDLKSILAHDGGLGDFDANRVVHNLEAKNQVSAVKFDDFLTRALQLANQNSEAFKKFMSLVMSDRVDVLVQKFLSLDFNKDGALNRDGFDAALLSYEFGNFTKEQSLEVFTIVSVENMFHYRTFIIAHNPNARISILSRSSTPAPTIARSDTPGTDRGMPVITKDTLSEGKAQAIAQAAMTEDPRLSKLSNTC